VPGKAVRAVPDDQLLADHATAGFIGRASLRQVAC
jgi:hypothetical protein